MGFWDNIKIANINIQAPKISWTGNGSSKKEQQNRNIFDNPLEQPPKDTFDKSYERFNDTDSAILQKSLVQYLPTDSLRIELQLENAEGKREEVKGEIEAAKLLGLSENKDKLTKLQQIELKISGYRSQYRELGWAYALTDIFTNTYNKTKDKIDQAKLSIAKNPAIIKVKIFLSGGSHNIEASEIIKKFDALQDNSKKMFAIKVSPYGETDAYFNNLAELMAKANKLDFQTKRILNPLNNTKSGISETFNRIYEKTRSFMKDFYTKTLDFTNNLNIGGKTKEDLIPPESADIKEEKLPVSDKSIFSVQDNFPKY